MVRKNSRTVQDLGERELIRRFQEIITPHEEALLMGNEDAVAVPIDKWALVVNSDMLVSSTDVLPGMTATDIAWKTGIMGLSDLAAKGANPYGIVVSIGFPETMTEKYALTLVEGLNEVCRNHDTFYLGGDTNQASELVINCTAFGTILQNQLIRRAGASPGDIVAVTGLFGYTGAFFEIALRGRKSPSHLIREIRNKALRPRARLIEGRTLAKANAASAAIDSSDGLAWSLHELAVASDVGFLINNLPVSPACEKFATVNNLAVDDLVLYGGEEFELVVTIPTSRWAKTKEEIRRVGGELIQIGVITRKGENLLEHEGVEKTIEARGYEHFLQ